MRPTIPAHKVIGDAGKPAQIINPLPEGDPVGTMPNRIPGNTESAAGVGPAKLYRPAHGGYATPAPFEVRRSATAQEKLDYAAQCVAWIDQFPASMTITGLKNFTAWKELKKTLGV